MSNFDPNAVIRGAQLTVVGAYRALQNPSLFEMTHYRQAFLAVVIGAALRLLVSAPIFGMRVLLGFIGLFTDLSAVTWDDDIISGLEFLEKSVLQVPVFLMSAMRYLVPTLDDMFMQSLEWVDKTYLMKHADENPEGLRALYYPNLRLYSRSARAAGVFGVAEAVRPFLIKYARRAGISIAVYFASFLPVVGRFVLPAASFYSFNKAVGPVPAAAVFGVGLLLPRRWMIVFLQGYFASRGLMRELLEPYFCRIKFDKEQKRRWFREREGLLFGFGVGFYLLLKIPWLGVLIYGIVEASTAYLITKAQPLPPPFYASKGFAETQVVWKNKHEFMKLDLDKIDRLNVKSAIKGAESPFVSSTVEKKGL
ncbi:unnamed protein product [Tuber melanosporum]|uniref:(Perigord truffle) hypothetical protein n=1 Tax=Tuber melanosporum (strain Mel28) TaxID=656061 RepID=D5G569_TUBMM|nr:uncharacterized protein GSTUM_00000280001 [Tuber melanosporum]CAZ79654.1 unnamed protein product [Tuber melanosporum]